MIQRLVNRLLLHRHYWRDVQFNELSELYTSMLLRSLASNILFIFIPLFMYQNGYSIQLIFAMFGFYFLSRVFADFGGGFMVARFGPKHTQIASCLLHILSAAQFMTIPEYHWSIAQLGFVWGLASSLFFLAYHVEFSKIKHTIHAGKEIGFMYTMEKIGALAGPIVGGLVGTFLGAQYIFGTAAIILLASLWPLFLTAEPTKIRQKLNFKDLPINKIRYDLKSYIGLGVENTLSVALWPTFIAIFVLTGSVYIQLGLLSSVSVLVAIMSAYSVGKLIDQRNARHVLRVSAIANALVHVFRPFVNTPATVLGTNILNEAVTNGYRMPYTKGMYAAADDLPGFRIAYIVSMEVMCSIAKFTIWFLLAILCGVVASRTAIYVGFMIAAAASLLIMTEQFKALSPRNHG